MPSMPGSIRSSSTRSGFVLAGTRRARPRRRRRMRLEPLGAQHDADHLGEGGVVVDDEYAWRHPFVSPSLPACRRAGTSALSVVARTSMTAGSPPDTRRGTARPWPEGPVDGRGPAGGNCGSIGRPSAGGSARRCPITTGNRLQAFRAPRPDAAGWPPPSAPAAAPAPGRRDGRRPPHPSGWAPPPAAAGWAPPPAPRAGRRRRSRACSPCGRSTSARCCGRRSARCAAIRRPCSARASWCSSSRRSRRPPCSCPSSSGCSAAWSRRAPRTSTRILSGTVGWMIVLSFVPIAVSVVAGAFLQGVMVVEVASGTLGERLTFSALWRRAATAHRPAHRLDPAGGRRRRPGGGARHGGHRRGRLRLAGGGDRRGGRGAPAVPRLRRCSGPGSATKLALVPSVDRARAGRHRRSRAALLAAHRGLLLAHLRHPPARRR